MRKKTSKSDRFIPIKQIEQVLKANKCSCLDGLMFCKVCGDTNPKNGFYPLFSSVIGGGIINLSSATCNRCCLTDEEYEKRFGEPKESIDQ